MYPNARYLFIAIFITGLTGMAGRLSAQDTQPGSEPVTRSSKVFHVGVKAGATFNQFNQSGMTIGFNGGAVLSSYVNEWFDIQAELLYIMQGSSRGDIQRSFSSIGGNVSYAIYTNRAVSLQSVEVPILAVFKLGSVEGNIRRKVLIGGSYGYCFAAFERFDQHLFFTDGTEGIAGNQIENVLSDYQVNQFNGIGGFGIDYSLTNGRIFGFEVRYEQGLNDISLFKSPAVGGALFKNTIAINFNYEF